MPENGLNTTENSPPQHGGGVIAASQRFAIPVSDWLDLSTGISPSAYPIPDIPPQYFYELPEPEDAAFQSVVCHYYGCRHFVAANGSQRLIELLPSLRQSCRVLLPDVGYQEHAYHWERNGHQVCFYDGFNPQQIASRIIAEKIDVVVLINPCNPSAAKVSREMVLAWQRQLANRDGWLIVDEAFVDVMPEYSVADVSHLPGIIVLRSLGKFFGLAGLRLGFALSSEKNVQKISQAVGLWAVTGPSRYVAAKAMNDKTWQLNHRKRLWSDSEWMVTTLAERLKEKIYQSMNAGLFISTEVETEVAEAIYLGLAEQGILIRHWPLPIQYGEKALLRFGLIGSDDGVNRQRFLQALTNLNVAPSL